MKILTLLALRKMSFTSEQIFKANTAMSSAEVESSQGKEYFKRIFIHNLRFGIIC